MPFASPAAIVTGTTISKTTFGDVVKADLDFLANPPACRVFHNATQSLADNTETTVAFNSERFDTDSMHDTATNNSRITINTAGLYLVGFGIGLAARGDFLVTYARIRLNGTTWLDTLLDQGNTTSTTPFLTGTTLWKFSAADYIELRVNQDNAGSAAVNIQASTAASTSRDNCEFWALWTGLG